MAKDTEQPEAEMSVHDKLHPVLGPTEEAQNVGAHAKQIVPVGAFTDPNNPMTASLSVNLPLEDAPLEHSPDYGQSFAETDAGGVTEIPEGTMSEGARTLPRFSSKGTQVGEPSDSRAFAALPEDRNEWTKANYQTAAQHYGLARSGNLDALKARVYEHEAAREEANEMSAQEWKDAVDEVDDESQLSELRAQYDSSDADFSTVEDAFDKKAAELSDSSGDDQS